MIPFDSTGEGRQVKLDPRLSLQERYGSHDGHVADVTKAAAHAVAEGFLLPSDATELIQAAQASAVLR
jgi:hypothetical protein